MRKKILLFVALIVAAFTAFFFWASSTTLNEKEYNRLVEYRASAEEVRKDTFSVMTYNIGYFSGMTNNLAVESDVKLYAENKDKAVRLIKKLQPDFIGFQEIDYAAKRSHYMNQLDTLGMAGEYMHGVRGVNWDKRYLPFPYWPISAHYGRMLSGQAILSKYPVKKFDRILLDKPAANPTYYNAFYIDRLIQTSKVQVNGQEIVLINVHLEAFDKVSRETQAQEVEKVYQQYEKDYPVLLIGDFNARQSMPASEKEKESTIERLRKLPNIAMAISDNEFQQGPKQYFTFNSDEPYEKIDYIFYNADKIEKVEARVVTEAGEISDHLPVMMKFTLK